MKMLFFPLMALLAGSSLAADLKIGTVDMRQVLSDYYKAQDLAKHLKEQETAYLKELQTLRLEGQKLARETQELHELSSNVALSLTAREETKKNFEQKQVNLREFEVRYDDLRAQREAELQRISAQGKTKILEDVVATTRQIGNAEGFNLVLNANKTEPAASDVLFSKNVDDLTQKVLATLNSTRPNRSGAKEK